MDFIYLGSVAALWLLVLGLSYGCRSLQDMGGAR